MRNFSPSIAKATEEKYGEYELQALMKEKNDQNEYNLYGFKSTEDNEHAPLSSHHLKALITLPKGHVSQNFHPPVCF